MANNSFIEASSKFPFATLAKGKKIETFRFDHGDLQPNNVITVDDAISTIRQLYLPNEQTQNSIYSLRTTTRRVVADWVDFERGNVQRSINLLEVESEYDFSEFVEFPTNPPELRENKVVRTLFVDRNENKLNNFVVDWRSSTRNPVRSCRHQFSKKGGTVLAFAHATDASIVWLRSNKKNELSLCFLNSLPAATAERIQAYRTIEVPDIHPFASSHPIKLSISCCCNYVAITLPHKILIVKVSSGNTWRSFVNVEKIPSIEEESLRYRKICFQGIIESSFLTDLSLCHPILIVFAETNRDKICVLQYNIEALFRCRQRETRTVPTVSIGDASTNTIPAWTIIDDTNIVWLYEPDREHLHLKSHKLTASSRNADEISELSISMNELKLADPGPEDFESVLKHFNIKTIHFSQIIKVIDDLKELTMKEKRETFRMMPGFLFYALVKIYEEKRRERKKTNGGELYETFRMMPRLPFYVYNHMLYTYEFYIYWAAGMNMDICNIVASSLIDKPETDTFYRQIDTFLGRDIVRKKRSLMFDPVSGGQPINLNKVAPVHNDKDYQSKYFENRGLTSGKSSKYGRPATKVNKTFKTGTLEEQPGQFSRSHKEVPLSPVISIWFPNMLCFSYNSTNIKYLGQDIHNNCAIQYPILIPTHVVGSEFKSTFNAEKYFQVDDMENGVEYFMAVVVERTQIHKTLTALQQKGIGNTPVVTYNIFDNIVSIESQKIYSIFRQVIMDTADYIGAHFVYQLDDNLEQAWAICSPKDSGGFKPWGEGFISLGNRFIIEPMIEMQSLIENATDETRRKVGVLGIKLWNHQEINNTKVIGDTFHISPVKAFGLFNVQDTKHIRYREKSVYNDVTHLQPSTNMGAGLFTNIVTSYPEQKIFNSKEEFSKSGPCEDFLYSFDLVFPGNCYRPMLVGNIGYYWFKKLENK